MTIYIANTTKQTIRHHFRAPESGRPLMVEIPSGQQTPIGDGWDSHQMQSVEAHLELFGARNVSLLKGTLKGFSGLLFSRKPMTTEQIEGGHESVVIAQEERSLTETNRASLAFDNISRNAKQRGGRKAKETKVAVIQQGDPRGGSSGKEVNYSLTVSEEGNSNAKLLT